MKKGLEERTNMHRRMETKDEMGVTKRKRGNRGLVKENINGIATLSDIELKVIYFNIRN